MANECVGERRYIFRNIKFKFAFDSNFDHSKRFDRNISTGIYLARMMRVSFTFQSKTSEIADIKLSWYEPTKLGMEGDVQNYSLKLWIILFIS